MKKIFVVIPMLLLLISCVACNTPVNSLTSDKMTSEIGVEEKENISTDSEEQKIEDIKEEKTEPTDTDVKFNNVIENPENTECSVNINIPAVSSYKIEKSTDGEYCIYDGKTYICKCYIVKKDKLGFEGLPYNHAMLSKSNYKWNLHTSETDGKISVYTEYDCVSEMLFVFNGKDKESIVNFISNITIECNKCKK